MTDTAQSSPSNDSAAKLDKQAVLTAAAALCGPDLAAAALLQKGLRRLVASADWSAEIRRLEQMGLSAQYFSGTLRDALNLPGDLVLLHNTANGFTLLHHMEQRW